MAADTEGSGRPPLSAEDMVALATSLLPSLLLQPTRILEDFYNNWWPWVTKTQIERVAGWVRAARPGLQELADACTHGVALALLSLSTATPGRSHADLTVSTVGGDAFLSEEAVAAFYATLHSNCVVKTLSIKGRAFGTPAAAAHLGRCLNRNSTLQKLHIDVIDIRRPSLRIESWGEATWTAFSEALTSNASLQELVVTGRSSGHISATLAAASHKLSALRSLEWSTGGDSQEAGQTATLSEMEGWSNMLKHNSTLTELQLGLRLPPRGGLAAICEAMLANTTLEHLTIAAGGPAVNVEVADAEALAAVLRTNPTLKHLDIRRSGILCNALEVDQGLSHNSSIEELGISLDPAGAQALMTLLQRGTSTATAASGSTGLVLQKLHLGTGKGQGFPTAGALGDMLASNRTLLELDLESAPYSKEEWATTILPALADNQSIQTLDLQHCPGVDGELVYDALLELLESNTYIQDINLNYTPLQKEGKGVAVKEVVRANKKYRAALEDVPTALTNSCRLVLCGSACAGKSTLLQTMMLLQQRGWPSYSSYYQKMKKWLFKDDNEVSRRTRGIDIHPLTREELTMWVWDFAGLTEFRSLQDFIFPNGSSVHAATAFVFMFNPIWDDINSSRLGQSIKTKHQFEQEFSYWLRFICSNAKPRPSRVSKPLVLVVITHKDRLKTEGTRQDVKRAAKECVRNMAGKFEHLVTLEATNLFFVDATDEDDPELTAFVDQTVRSMRSRIDNVRKVPTICDVVSKALGGGQQLEPIISKGEFHELCKSVAQNLHLQQLFSLETSGAKLCNAVAAYLHDAGEVLYFPILPFIVRNPRWFAHGILGYLVNISSAHGAGSDDHDGGIDASCCCVMKREVQQMKELLRSHDLSAPSFREGQKNKKSFQNGLVSKDSLSELLERALNIVGLNPRGVNTDQLIQLMENLELCYATGHDTKYLLPAIFEDEGDKAAKGERQRSWKVLTSSTHIFVSRRLQCSDSIQTFLTPGFFPRLQVVLHNRAGERCTLEKNLCHLDFNGMEILVEHSGSSGYSVDIMAQSSQPREETIKFVEKEIISRIRRLCASTKGCQGVTLAEAIIRPDCVGAHGITLCRYRQSILVDELRRLVATTPNYMHNWGAIRAEDGTAILHATVHNPQALLYWEDEGQGGPRAEETCYPNANWKQDRKRGMALIVSMETKRLGAAVDRGRLEILATVCGFREVVLVDPVARDLTQIINDLVEEDVLEEDECFLGSINGHGGTRDGQPYILDRDGAMIMVMRDIVEPFRRSKHLQGKPKVIFINCCRGRTLYVNSQTVDVNYQSMEADADAHQGTGTSRPHVTNLSDCLLVFSTSEDSPSCRDPLSGSIFVKHLVETVVGNRQKMDVLNMMTVVNSKVNEEQHLTMVDPDTKTEVIVGQCCEYRASLRKKLYWQGP